MSNGQQFNATLGAWARKAGANLDALARQSAQQLADNVVRDTPVDTGFLRGSWQPSIGEPVDAEGKLDPSGAAAQAQIGLTIAGLKAGDRFFMLNNASYAVHLEYGTSKMSGRFFVGDNVKRWPLVVEQMARDLQLTK